MLPKNETDLSAAEITEMPSLTYILNIGEQTIQEMTDGLDAVRQAVQLILAAERYEYAIFSWDYGVELQDLFGKDRDYVFAELQRRITDALTQDDRITEVTDFDFNCEKGKITVKFTVHSSYGDFESEVNVDV